MRHPADAYKIWWTVHFLTLDKISRCNFPSLKISGFSLFKSVFYIYIIYIYIICLYPFTFPSFILLFNFNEFFVAKPPSLRTRTQDIYYCKNPWNEILTALCAWHIGCLVKTIIVRGWLFVYNEKNEIILDFLINS